MKKPTRFQMINVEVVPKEKQRYATLGDYWTVPGTVDMDIYKVSDMKNEAYHVAILVHELVEYELCKKVGITEEDITEFDKWFEAEGLEGEPGDHLRSPYRKQHRAATEVENMVIKAFGLEWDDYEKACEEMFV